MPDFQQPSFLQPLQFPNVTPSLDDVFNKVLQYKIQQNQLKSSQLQVENQQAQSSLQYAPYGFTPQQVAQNPQAVPNAMAGLNAQQTPFNPQATPLANQQSVPPQMSPLEQGIQSYIRNQQNLATLGIKKEQAGIGATEASAAKSQSEAAVNQLFTGNIGGLNDWATNLRKDVESGHAAPSQAFTEASRMGPQGLGKVLVDKALSGLDIAGLENKYQANQTGGRAEAEVQKGQGQRVGALAGTLEDVLNQARPLVQKLNPTQFKLLNNAWTQGLASVNDKDANKVLAYMNEAKGLYSGVLANGAAAQTADKEMASESIGRGLNLGGYDGMMEAVTFAANSKVKRTRGKGFDEPSQATPQPVKKTLKNGRTVMVVPSIHGGYDLAPDQSK